MTKTATSTDAAESPRPEPGPWEQGWPGGPPWWREQGRAGHRWSGPPGSAGGPPWWYHRRRPTLLLPVLIAAIQVAGAALVASGSGDPPLDGLGYALLLLGPAALVWRRTAPLTTLAVTLVATYGYLLLSYPRGPYFLAAFVALVSAAHRARRVAVWVVAAVCFLPALATAFMAGTLMIGPYTVGAVPEWAVVVAGLGTVFALAVGEAIRARRAWFAEQHRSRTEAGRARAEQSRRQASDERLRIARELHDVLGHHLSLINVRAGVALHLLDREPAATDGQAPPPSLDVARDALGAIKLASAEALREVRGLLATLAPREAPRTPTPGLAALDELVDEAQAAGTPVHIVRSGTPRPVPGEVERAAYRIVRESLTNVRRHAGPGALVTVTLDYAADGLTVRVADTGSGPGPSTTDDADPTAGSGITSMRERAAALGGWLRAGAGPDGVGFVVEAFLPADEGYVGSP